MESKGNIKNINDFDKRILNKYLKILPKKVKLYYLIKETETSKSILFYLANKMQNKIDINNIYGNIAGVLLKNKENEDDIDSTIQWVGTNSKFTGKGIGAFLKYLQKKNKRIYASSIDTIQDFLIKLGMKPYMHQWKISIFH